MTRSTENDAGSIPIRLCCGERHLGPVCPDSRVMCCLCFERFAQDDLAFDPVIESKVDVCQPCYDAEQTRVIPPEGGVSPNDDIRLKSPNDDTRLIPPEASADV